MADSVESSTKLWQVYMVLASDDSLYTGITTDIERRFDQHQNGRGAKYFRGRTAQRVVYLEAGHDRSSASRREAQIKKLRPLAKRQLITSAANQLPEHPVTGITENPHD